MGWVAQGWYPDPTRRHQLRWFSAGEPTDLVQDGGVEGHDLLGEYERRRLRELEPMDEAQKRHLWERSMPDLKLPSLPPADRQPTWLSLLTGLIATGALYVWLAYLSGR